MNIAPVSYNQNMTSKTQNQKLNQPSFGISLKMGKFLADCYAKDNLAPETKTGLDLLSKMLECIPNKDFVEVNYEIINGWKKFAFKKLITNPISGETTEGAEKDIDVNLSSQKSQRVIYDIKFHLGDALKAVLELFNL